VTAEAEGRRAALTRLKELAKRSAAIGRVHAWGRETRVGRRTAERVWKDGLPEELAFWEKRLRDPDVATNWHAYAHRTDPDAPVGDPVVTALLDQIPEADVSILDVGAGPLTALGKTHPGKNVRITATDPLADHYNRILREAGIDPPVQTVACRGEELRERFAAGTFDIAFSQNALDHSIDPAKVIEDMVELVGEGRYVVLRHLRREGRGQNYWGLHQWNFDLEDGDFVLWRARREKVNMTRRLARVAQLEAEIRDGWIICLITKRGRESEHLALDFPSILEPPRCVIEAGVSNKPCELDEIRTYPSNTAPPFSGCLRTAREYDEGQPPELHGGRATGAG
jgi:SAM-dependent methyltransferase